MTTKITEWIFPLEAFGLIRSKNEYLSHDGISETLNNAALFGGVRLFGVPDGCAVSRKIEPDELSQCRPIDVSGNLYLKNPPLYHTSLYAFSDLKIDKDALEQYINTLPSPFGTEAEQAIKNIAPPKTTIKDIERQLYVAAMPIIADFKKDFPAKKFPSKKYIAEALSKLSQFRTWKAGTIERNIKPEKMKEEFDDLRKKQKS